MTTFFVLCAALGGGVLVVQLLLGLLGVVDAGAMWTWAMGMAAGTVISRRKGSTS